MRAIKWDLQTYPLEFNNILTFPSMQTTLFCLNKYSDLKSIGYI